MNLKNIRERHDILTLLVAAVAVFLSQFPPVYQWFYSPEIEVRAEQSFFLFPEVGSGISVSKYYSATNVGEEPGRVKSVYLIFTDKNGKLLHEVRSQGYKLHGAGDFGRASWEPFTELSLKPGDNWSHLISFNRQLTNFELDEMRRVHNEFRYERIVWDDAMEAKGWDIRKFDANRPRPRFEVSSERVANLRKKIIEQVSWLKVGNYILHEVSITSDSQLTHSYEFSIDDYHVSRFADSINGFSSGLDSNLPSVVFEMSQIDTELSSKLKEKIKKHNK